MLIYALGTGASESTPTLYYKNEVTRIATALPYQKRKQSAYLVIGGKNTYVLVDVGFPVENYINVNIDAVFLSHWHSDHDTGLYTLRWSARKIPLFCPKVGAKREIVEEPRNLRIQYVKPFREYVVGKLKITPVPLAHGPENSTFGYIIEDKLNTIYYLLDTKGLPSETAKYLRKRGKADAVIVDSAFISINGTEIPVEKTSTPRTHNTLEEALQIGSKYGKRTYLTHIPPYAPSVYKIHKYLRKKGYRNVEVLIDGALIEP